MNQTNTLRTIKWLILLVVVGIVSYFAIQRYMLNNPSIPISSPFPFSTQTPSPTPARTLTPEEQAVLKIPLHYASSEEKEQHAQQVTKLAVTATTLDITSCKPNPTVYQVKLNGSFTIINKDPVPHTLRYTSSQILVPSYGSTTIKTSQLFKTPGDYGYGCDNPFAKAGVIVVR